jgi:hypothetical protein
VAAPTLRSALNYYLQQPKLSAGDRAHLKRWLNETRDPVWEQLADDVRKYGELPTYVEGPYSYFIASALRARRFAEGEVISPALQRKRDQQREQQERSDLLALAHKLEEAVRDYEACRKAQHPQVVPSPTGLPVPELPQRAEAKRSLEWLRREAHRLRQLAEKVSAGEQNWWDRIPVRVSRQSGGKGKRNQSRNLGVFMQRMVNCMYECCGEPRHYAVAAMTNIAFPDADVTAENVRSACRPTTRVGRRRSGALSPIK